MLESQKERAETAIEKRRAAGRGHGGGRKEGKKRNGKKKAAHALDFCDGTIALQQVADCFCSHVCNAGVVKAARAKCVCVGKRTKKN